MKSSSPIPQPSSLLIVRTDRLGDLVLTLPMASEIKRARPKTKVSFLVRDYTRALAERCEAIDHVLTIDSATSLWQRIRLFRSGHWDTVFFPNAQFPSALAAFLARIPERIGTGYRWYSFLFNRRILEHRRSGAYNEAEHNLRMLMQCGIEPDLSALPAIQLHNDELSAAHQWISANLGAANARFAALHLPSSGSSKDWPLDRFVELAKSLRDDFGFAIVLTGVESDRQILFRAQESIGTRAHLFISHPLPELAALLKNATLVISNSTGPGHLAAALGTPTIGLYPLPLALARERWGFRGKRVINLAPPPVEGCPNCAECSCMERIAVSDVIKALHDLVD